MEKKIGLVLSGGGAKGAYHVGVWKALEKLGISQNISVFSGTSVGALNAALFAQGDYQIAEKTWRSITTSDVLFVNVEKISKQIISFVAGLKLNIPKPLVVTQLLSEGIFSREGLSRLIDQNLCFQKIKNIGHKVYAACTQMSAPPRVKYFALHQETEELSKKILLASSAIPIVFGKELIYDEYYYDGYFGDDIPVMPAIEKEGCNIIINVFLDRQSFVPHDEYPKVHFIDIVPQHDLGNFFSGTLNFDMVEKRIYQGYCDAIRVFEHGYRMSSAQYETVCILERMKVESVQAEKIIKEEIKKIEEAKRKARELLDSF